MELHYGLSPGDLIEISWGDKDRVRKVRARVVGEYPHHILVDIGIYRTSINKVDIHTERLKIRKIKGGEEHGRNKHHP